MTNVRLQLISVAHQPTPEPTVGSARTMLLSLKCSYLPNIWRMIGGRLSQQSARLEHAFAFSSVHATTHMINSQVHAGADLTTPTTSSMDCLPVPMPLRKLKLRLTVLSGPLLFTDADLARARIPCRSEDQRRMQNIGLTSVRVRGGDCTDH